VPTIADRFGKLDFNSLKGLQVGTPGAVLPTSGILVTVRPSKTPAKASAHEEFQVEIDETACTENRAIALIPDHSRLQYVSRIQVD